MKTISNKRESNLYSQIFSGKMAFELWWFNWKVYFTLKFIPKHKLTKSYLEIIFERTSEQFGMHYNWKILLGHCGGSIG